MAITRRALLTAGATGAVAAGAGAGVAEGVLPGRTSLYRHLHLDGPDGVVPTAGTGEIESGVLRSRARDGRRCGWSIAWPSGPRAGLPVVVVLHGRGGDHSSAFSPSYLGLDRFRDAAVATGVPAYALASVDGGEAYWHARADGDDPAAMVVDELLPLLAERGLDTSRLGLLGWSMGGYGALRLAGMLGRDRVSAVAAMSPALWHHYADTAPGAYDGPQDFAATPVIGRQRQLEGIATRVDCGLGDPFCGATQDYVAGFAEAPAGGFQRGDHDLGYWRRMAGPQTAFVGRHL